MKSILVPVIAADRTAVTVVGIRFQEIQPVHQPHPPKVKTLDPGMLGKNDRTNGIP